MAAAPAPAAGGYAITATIHVCHDPIGVALSRDGTHAYVANAASGSVSVISTATNHVTGIVHVGGHPAGVTVSPDGTRAYVTNQGYPGSVSVIDTATNQVTATIEGLSHPYGVAVAPGGTHIYVTNPPLGTVSVITRQ